MNYGKLIAKLNLSLIVFYLSNLVVYANIDDVKNSRESVVRVLNVSGREGMAMGSGFAIGKEGESIQYFVTCYHIFQDGVGEVKIIYEKKRIGVEIYKSNINKDIVILKVDKSVNDLKPLIFSKIDEVDITDDVYSLGYPGILDDFFESEFDSLTALEEEVAVGSGTVNKMFNNDNENDMIVHDAKISEGNSGGPLVNERGEVIGMNEYINVTESNVVYGQAISSSEIIQMLNLNNIEYEKSPKENKVQLPIEENKEIDTKSDIDKKKNESEYEDSLDTYINNAIYKGDKRLVIGSLVFTVLVIILVIVFIIPGKKSIRYFHNNKNDKSIGNNNYPAIKALFKSSNVDLISLENGPVKFGRNTSECGFVFNENDTEISNIHCEVFWNKVLNKIYIVDKSKNGIFLEDGTRIEKENFYELQVNDKFYLSDSSKLFKIVL